MSENIYQAPQADVSSTTDDSNTSGMGEGHPLPPGVAGWGWGAFLWGWLWCCCNGMKPLIIILSFVPYVNIVMAFVVGANGRKWAWQNKRWDSYEHFEKTQKKWAKAYLYLILVSFTLAIIVGIIGAIAG